MEIEDKLDRFLAGNKRKSKLRAVEKQVFTLLERGATYRQVCKYLEEEEGIKAAPSEIYKYVNRKDREGQWEQVKAVRKNIQPTASARNTSTKTKPAVVKEENQPAPKPAAQPAEKPPGTLPSFSWSTERETDLWTKGNTES